MKTSRSAIMAIAIALAALHAMTVVDAGQTFDFFPADAGDDVASMPTAWSLSNQTAYPDLASAAEIEQEGAGLLTVAVHSFSTGEAAIVFRPGAPCDGANVTLAQLEAMLEDDTAPAPAPARRHHRHHRRHRRSLASLSSPSSSRALLQSAPDTEFQVTRRCRLERVAYTVDGAAGTAAATDLQPLSDPSAPPGGGGAADPYYRLELPAGLADGQHHCLKVSATYSTGPGDFETTPDYAAALGSGALPERTVLKRTICVLKLNEQATADVAFDMCTSDQFTVNISDFAPLPVNITLNGARLDGGDNGAGATLVRPLVKVFGRRVAGLDGTPAPEDDGYDASAEGGAGQNWVSKFVALPSDYSGGGVSVALSPDLAEGVYNLSAVASLVTAYPRLVNLSGLNQIEQEDATGAEAGVSGLHEAATRVLFEGSLVGLQRASTPTILSAISCTSHAPSQDVAEGDTVTLEWRFNGAGSATCKHDGAPVSNAPNGKCVSPLNITALPFGDGAAAATAAHAVVVAFDDVCGRRRTAEFSYARTGVTAVTPTEVLNSDGTVSVGGGPLTSTGGATVTPRNGADVGRPLLGALAASLGAGALLAAALF